MSKINKLNKSILNYVISRLMLREKGYYPDKKEQSSSIGLQRLK